MWISFRRSGSGRRARAARGFTLIELLAVLSIVLIVSVILLTNNNKFNSAILLRSLAYEVGISVREAQLYGVAVKGAQNGGGSTVFSAAYGVYLDNTMVGVPFAQYFIFADLNNNKQYDPGSDTIADQFKVGSGFQIGAICYGTGSAMTCTQCPSVAYPLGVSSCTVQNPMQLIIYFQRPNPDAVIKQNTLGTLYSNAYVEVFSPVSGAYRWISVTSTGEINVLAGGSS